MVNYVLHYFDGVALRAEFIRLCFEYGKVPYEQVLIPHPDWLKHKPNYPTGSVPLLEVDDVKIADSTAIGRFVAKQVGLAGGSDVDAALIDGFVAQAEDLTTILAGKKVFFKIAEGKGTEIADEIRASMKPFMERLEAHLSKCSCPFGAAYLVGKKISWADLNLADLIYRMEWTVADLTKPFPAVKKWVDDVHGLPQLKEYFAKRDKGMGF